MIAPEKSLRWESSQISLDIVTNLMWKRECCIIQSSFPSKIKNISPMFCIQYSCQEAQSHCHFSSYFLSFCFSIDFHMIIEVVLVPAKTIFIGLNTKFP